MSSSRRSASREQLLDAAIDVIAERGLAGAGIGEIASRAGIAKTSLYHHFGSRAGLLAAVVGRVGLLWIEEIQKAAFLEGNAFARLDRVLDAWREIVTERPHLVRFLVFVQLDQSPESEDIRNALAEALRRALDAIADGIEDTIGTRLADTELVAHTMLGLFVAAALRHSIDPEDADLDALFGELRRVVWLSIAARMPTPMPTGESR